MREMVEVILYEDGTYEVRDIDPGYGTQRMSVSRNGKRGESYFCLKGRWKHYLLRLCNTNSIDKKIAELQKGKKKIEEIKREILSEIGEVK